MVKDQKGQALMEFALVLPILILLMIGIVEFGRVSYTYMYLHLTSQETVRLGGIGKADADITQFARSNFSAGDSASLEVIISPTELQRKSGDYVTVTLRYPITNTSPFLSNILPSPYVVSTKSTVRVE
ncbi:MAG: pilus assembly protein [Alkaliphilus sp.]|nr:pilus assembly protein [Alkaliphilus sp.]